MSEREREFPLGGSRSAEELPGRAYSPSWLEEAGDADDSDEDDDDEPATVEAAPGADEAGPDDLSFGEAGLDPLLLEAADPEKCRSIRRHYRQLIRAVQQRRDDIVHTASDSLSEALEEANVLFDEVSRTQEAALDAQFLVLASDLGKEKARQLNADVSCFNQGAFGDYLFLFAGRSWLERGEGPGHLDDGAARGFWAALHREASAWVLLAEPFRFLFGAFRPEPLPKPRALLPRRAGPEDHVRAMPTKLRRLDLHANHEATEKEVERILGLLQTYFRRYPDTPVSYFEFVVDPKSFSRTVENIFYVSFIIRDGFARIRLDRDRLPILEPIRFGRRGEDCDFGYHGRKQGVISLSLQDWKNIVATFEISEAMITNAC
ncbi:EP300-interacting inhibitor of differentiation 3 [Suncus etruscus]|uniref:EP300-interacting inhibitor of differentiation 3 n=1 Tax=Suncus etruscus TaxID=109475 RepID=UPI00210F7782|nr:EP300-interacting inhibitor of differentiation 3 [Suncus etruscus]